MHTVSTHHIHIQHIYTPHTPVHTTYASHYTLHTQYKHHIYIHMTQQTHTHKHHTTHIHTTYIHTIHIYHITPSHAPDTPMYTPHTYTYTHPPYTHLGTCVCGQELTHPASPLGGSRGGINRWQHQLWVWSHHVDVCGLALGTATASRSNSGRGPTLFLKVTGSSLWKNLL